MSIWEFLNRRLTSHATLNPGGNGGPRRLKLDDVFAPNVVRRHSNARRLDSRRRSAPELARRIDPCMLSGCRYLVSRMSSFTVAANAASVAARANYAKMAPLSARPAPGFGRSQSRHIAVTPVCMGRKAAKVAAKKVRSRARPSRVFPRAPERRSRASHALYPIRAAKFIHRLTLLASMFRALPSAAKRRGHPHQALRQVR